MKSLILTIDWSLMLYRDIHGLTECVNEYNLDVSASTAVNMRVHHLTPPIFPSVRGSFVRKITEDFIIPLKTLTLLTKIGEGISK